MPTSSGRIALAAAVLVLAAGCSPSAGPGSAAPPGAATPASSAPAPATAPAAPATAPAAPAHRPAHVVIAVFENEDAGALRDAPFLAGLAARGTAYTDAHGVAHPSQPNYLALFSGSTQGVTDDSCPQTSRAGNLAAQLRAAGLSFTGYSEGLPAAGYTGCGSGGYARKHNPWVDFPALPAAVNQPYSAWPADPAQLPTVAVVVPDLCHDMHDCPVPVGDDWARAHLGPYAAWAATHDSLLVVTFDEDDGTAANHIATFAVGAGVPVGTSAQRVDHYSVLRTVEDLYGLPPLGAAAQAAPLPGVGG